MTERKTVNNKNYLPAIHFAPSYGWMNDPNGLVFHDGKYELYFQHNPDGTEWNRMTWGHACSTDLLHWEEKGDVLLPDENGTIYSGCAVPNDHGLAGLPKSAILYYYTAAGHHSEASAGKPFSIRMAVSLDGGKTLKKCDGEVIPSPGWESRDPKVFYHEPTKAYIMVLWLVDHLFGIWRSEDLITFKQTQVFSLAGGFECPDLFKLPVTDKGGKGCGSKYVFWAADGSYYIGEFDGYQFKQEQKRKLAYLKTPGGSLPGNTLPYAAQSFSGLGARVVSIAWLRTRCVGEQTTGVMSLPRELGLVRKGTEYVLSMRLPAEVRRQESEQNHITCGEIYFIRKTDKEKSIVVRLSIPCNNDKSEETIYYGYHSPEIAWSVVFTGLKGEELLHIECIRDTGMLKFRHGTVTDFMDMPELLVKAEFIYDRGILEASGNDGMYYFILDFPELRAVTCCGFHIESGNIEAECSEL
jgi:fructan beta-fructosidase